MSALVDVIQVLSVPLLSFCRTCGMTLTTYFHVYPLLFCARTRIIKMLPGVTPLLSFLFLDWDEYCPSIGLGDLKLILHLFCRLCMLKLKINLTKLSLVISRNTLFQ
jgi:hypothetical protein